MTDQRPIPFDNSYARLGEGFFARTPATPVALPSLISVNDALAERLGISPDWLRSADGVAMLAGNRMPLGADPLAQAYAGHQFGGLSPQLGDGRALLLGEVVAPDGHRFDLQLKGSGPTPFSRMGDGRAWMGPVLREYLVSEFMAAMAIPTTRALAAVATGDKVQRETALPGAVLCRVASSHIRVGTFEFYAIRGDEARLRALTEHVIARHYPDAKTPLDLLNGVIARQARTIAGWMGLGFIHGVMNTDNMSVSGETIDYGPCAFMDVYHPDTVFSSIDRNGRYAYSNQPNIAVWNLAQLASCLIPLMGEEAKAIADATEAVHRFPDLYQAAWLEVFRHKLGLTNPNDDDQRLIEDLLTLMANRGADFTQTFVSLTDAEVPTAFGDDDQFAHWQSRWLARAPDHAAMARVNPRRIPRNHRIQQVITAAVGGDYAPFHRLLDAVTHPLDAQSDWDDLADAPSETEAVWVTYCGT
ncbi:MAG: YdiU family protein [Paracoccus denitrificans]|nr:MAG: YdiU family protein [Paracoccus denitrificans]PZO83485.1 MAG: YdiU family protein [Paracoccus denitrificans]